MTIKRLTQTGTLVDGIPFGDAVHYDFELRIPLMADTGNALDETDERLGTVEGYAADGFYKAALFAHSLVKLGDIPVDEITSELLYEHLTEDDYARLNAAKELLKVKKRGGNPDSPDSGSQDSPSDNTA